MHNLMLNLLAAVCCASSLLTQAAAAPGQEFRLDAGHRHAAIKLVRNQAAGVASATVERVVVTLSHVEAPGTGFGYLRLTALCEDGGEAWRAAISPYPPDRPGRFMHSLAGTAACTPDRIVLELVMPKAGEDAHATSIEGVVSVE